jgi:hypothetical protein
MQNAGEISQLGGRHYFYYTLTGKAAGEPRSDLRRLPASEIKSRVLGSISEFLSNSLRVAEQFPALTVRDTKLLTSAPSTEQLYLQRVRKRKRPASLIVPSPE